MWVYSSTLNLENPRAYLVFVFFFVVAVLFKLLAIISPSLMTKTFTTKMLNDLTYCLWFCIYIIIL